MDRLLDNFSLPRNSHLRALDLLSKPSAYRAYTDIRGAQFHASRFALVQCTSFQYSFFVSQASQVNTSKNSTTQTPRERRAACAGSPT
jgi:hypothetical protein